MVLFPAEFRVAVCRAGRASQWVSSGAASETVRSSRIDLESWRRSSWMSRTCFLTTSSNFDDSEVVWGISVRARRVVGLRKVVWERSSGACLYGRVKGVQQEASQR